MMTTNEIMTPKTNAKMRKKRTKITRKTEIKNKRRTKEEEEKEEKNEEEEEEYHHHRPYNRYSRATTVAAVLPTTCIFLGLNAVTKVQFVRESIFTTKSGTNALCCLLFVKALHIKIPPHGRFLSLPGKQYESEVCK